MANPDRPNGMVPMSINGVEPPTNEWPCAAGEATALGAGDIVDYDGTNVGRAAAGAEHVIGVFKGCRYTDSNGHLVYSTYKPASTAATCYIYDDPNQEFHVQCDDGGSVAIAETLIGRNADHLDAAPTQLATSGRSNQELDTDTNAATPATLKIVRLYNQVDMVFSSTEADSRFGRVVVKIAEHALGPVRTTAGTIQTVPDAGV